MRQRFVAAGLAALAFALLSARPAVVAARVAEDGYEIWADCRELPDMFEFLPIYLGSDTPGFVDLGQAVELGGVSWRALQYTRDKNFGSVRVATGRWYGGMGAERWPARTVDPARQLEAFRITAWEVDGRRFPVDPSCVLTLATDDLSLGLYNIWVRFSEPGTHTLKVIGRQVRDFYFVFPFEILGGADPYALGGRRVFLRGESVGDVLDGDFVHTYDLQVGREERD